MSALGPAGAAKRTLSALLKSLPQNGIGTVVARDTWHPLSGKHWEITSVRPKKSSEDHLEAYGYLYFRGERTHVKSKRIASVWKYGWYLKDETVPPGSSSPGLSQAAAPQPAGGSDTLALQPARRSMPQSASKCLMCQQAGHSSSQCPQRLTHKCQVCEGSGHWSNDCPQRFKRWKVWLGGLSGQQKAKAALPHT